MSNLRPAATRHRRVVWLMWLLLLLPLAQTAATVHVYTHGLAEDSEDTRTVEGKFALSHAPCDICLTAAALMGGAPPAEPPALSPSTALQEAPHAKSGSVWISPIVPAYESRAPPLALR